MTETRTVTLPDNPDAYPVLAALDIDRDDDSILEDLPVGWDLTEDGKLVPPAPGDRYQITWEGGDTVGMAAEPTDAEVVEGFLPDHSIVVEARGVDSWTGRELGYQVTLHPDEPPCRMTEDARHDWREEEGSVIGHGGGVVITETCRHCQMTKTTDTWAPDGSGGVMEEDCIAYDDAPPDEPPADDFDWN